MHILRVLPFFREAYRLTDALAQRERLPRSELSGLQLERINRVWRHAIAHVPHYRRLFRELGLPREFQSISEYTSTVPVLDRTTVRRGAILSERPRPGKWAFTSGSTGIPLAVYVENETGFEMLCCQYRSRTLWGVDIFDPSVVFWGRSSHLVPGLPGLTARIRGYVEDSLRNRVRLSAYRLGKEDLRLYLRKIVDFEPVFLYGYPSAVYLLALEAMEAGLGVESLKLIMLTSENVTRNIRDVVQQAFRTNVVEEYGAVECNVIAYEDRQHLLRVREDVVMVETLPTQDNYYRIIISVLNNPSFPLLRYEIGDLSQTHVTQTNPGFAVLGPVIGKTNDFLISRSGRRIRVDEIVGIDALGFNIQDIPSFRRFRAHQFSDGRVLFWVEVDSPAKRIDVDRVRKSVSAILEGQPVEVRMTQSIPLTYSGKHRWITSELV